MKHCVEDVKRKYNTPEILWIKNLHLEFYNAWLNFHVLMSWPFNSGTELVLMANAHGFVSFQLPPIAQVNPSNGSEFSWLVIQRRTSKHCTSA